THRDLGVRPVLLGFLVRVGDYDIGLSGRDVDFLELLVQDLRKRETARDDQYLHAILRVLVRLQRGHSRPNKRGSAPVWTAMQGECTQCSYGREPLRAMLGAVKAETGSR